MTTDIPQDVDTAPKPRTPRKRRANAGTGVRTRRKKTTELPDAVVPVPTAPEKPNWLLRATWVLAAVVFWMYFNANVLHKHKTPDVAPDTTPSVSLYAAIAPLFPAGSETDALRYAAWFEACATKAKRDGKPISEKTRTAVREQYGLDNPELAAVIAAKMAGFKEVGEVWTDAQLRDYCDIFHDASQACLAAAAD